MDEVKAITLLNEMVSGQSLRNHSLAVGLVCENFARSTGNSTDKYFITGVLHDADWEKHPCDHPKVIVKKLQEMGEEEIAHAISCHGREFGVPQISLLDRVLIASDELTGFVMACAKVRSDGLTSLGPESVAKKFKDKKFATGISRDEVEYGLKVLGVEFNAFTEFIIQTLKPHSGQIGLPAFSDIEYFPFATESYEDNNQLTRNRHKVIPAPAYLSEIAPVQNLEYTRPPLDEQQKIRHEKREQLLAKGLKVYPGNSFDVNIYAAQIQNGDVEPGSNDLHFAGRIMNIRESGRTMFIDLQDRTGQIQLWISEEMICPGEDKTFYKEFCRKMLDRGDIIGVAGIYFITRTGEKSIKVLDLKLLTKALRPLPAMKQSAGKNGEVIIHDNVTDPEFVYRQRYADLLVHPEKREIFSRRTRIIDVLRGCLNDAGALEVDTPILQPIYGGAAARPFKTHHNTLDTTLYLRIANELYLKRLIVGGFDAVYEFSKDFRNEGMSRWHNPEFTQVEAYFAFKDYRWMMDFVEATVEAVVKEIYGETAINSFDQRIDFKRPWRRISMRDAIMDTCGIDIFSHDEDSLRSAIKEINLGIPVDTIVGKGKLVDELFGNMVEPNLIQPTFITGYPVELSPLAKKSDHDPTMTDRFEGFCVGKEFCNAFSEINDPVDQRERFEEQLKLGIRGDTEAMMMDEDFLRALEYGMPPTAGLGLGIDRLCMILLDQKSIQDVLLFPQMRTEKFD